MSNFYQFQIHLRRNQTDRRGRRCCRTRSQEEPKERGTRKVGTQSERHQRSFETGKKKYKLSIISKLKKNYLQIRFEA